MDNPLLLAPGWETALEEMEANHPPTTLSRDLAATIRALHAQNAALVELLSRVRPKSHEPTCQIACVGNAVARSRDREAGRTKPLPYPCNCVKSTVDHLLSSLPTAAAERDARLNAEGAAEALGRIFIVVTELAKVAADAGHPSVGKVLTAFARDVKTEEAKRRGEAGQ